MQKQIVLFADAAGQITGDDQANPSTVVLRDSGDNINTGSLTAGGVTANEVLNLGTHASVTGVVALDATAVIWPFDGTSSAFAPTLPAVATCAGRVYIAKRTSVAAHNITLTPNGSETIDGAATYVLSSQWSTVWLYSDGTQWLILAKF